MRDISVSDFLDYLGVEQSNLLASVVNLTGDMGLFQELDAIFREPLAGLKIAEAKIDEYIIAMLYLYSLTVVLLCERFSEVPFKRGLCCNQDRH